MTKYSMETRDKVFKLYATGEPIERLCKKIGISKTIFYKWMKKYDWKKRSSKIQEKVSEQVDETIAQIKKRQHELVRDILKSYKKQLKNGIFIFRTGEIVNIMKHELHLVGEAESSTANKPQEELLKKMENWFS